MKRKTPKKTRSAASYRAASLKGARTQLRMKQARIAMAEEIIRHMQPKQYAPRTIDLLPKVKWP